MFPRRGPIRTVTAPVVPGFFVLEMAEDTEILFDAIGEFGVFHHFLHDVRDDRAQSQLLQRGGPPGGLWQFDVRATQFHTGQLPDEQRASNARGTVRVVYDKRR